MSEMKRWTLPVLTLMVAGIAWYPDASWAQRRLTASSVPADVVLDYLRPRIALASDGSFAIAYEALVEAQPSGHRNFQVGVQRYAPTGTPVGPTYFFDGESCSGLDIWLSDLMEHAELAFRSDGVLLVLMQHTGEFQFGGDGVRSAEATLGAIDPAGNLVDLNGSDACVQQKLIFPGGDRQDRPRFALLPGNEVLVTVDGFFGGASLRNVAIRVLDSRLDEVQGLDEVIPHDDPGSTQAFHMVPDIATNGSLVLSVWQECPIVDAQGNAAECDISAQFASIAQGALAAVGGNRTVTAGDPNGTVSIWPSAAMNAAGTSLVVWADTRGSTTGEIYGQRFDASGQPVGANVKISEGLGLIYDRPEVRLLDDGRALVVWTDSSAQGFAARGRHLDAAGQPTGSSFVLATGGLQSGAPALATNGDAIVSTWVAGTTGSVGVFTSNLGRAVASERSGSELPVDLVLEQSHPNPFRTRTLLRFYLPAPTDVTLDVWDVMGRRVATVAAGARGAGWHEAAFDAGNLPAGLYLYRLQAGGRMLSRPMTLVR